MEENGIRATTNTIALSDSIRTRARALLTERLGMVARHAPFVGDLDAAPNADGWRDVGSLLDIGKHASQPSYRILWHADRDDVRIEQEAPAGEVRYAYQWLGHHDWAHQKPSVPAPASIPVPPAATADPWDDLPPPTHDELRSELAAVVQAAEDAVRDRLKTTGPFVTVVAQLEHYRQSITPDGMGIAGSVAVNNRSWMVVWNQRTKERRLREMR